MRFSPPLTRRVAVHAALGALLASCGPNFDALAATSPRQTAQSVGIDQREVGVLADPRALLDGDGMQPLIWGARERCDPTDTTCKQGGIATASDGTQPVPAIPDPALKVSDRVSLILSVGGERVGVIELGLWRSAAPQSVDSFVKLAAGTLVTRDTDDPASLDRSVAARVLRDRAVVLGALKKTGGSTMLVAGQTRPQTLPVAPPTTTDAPNGLSHAAAGLLSVRRGGGSFEFTLLPRPNTELDREQLVIGQVLNADGMAVLERINTLPTDNRRSAPLAPVRVERATVVAG